EVLGVLPLKETADLPDKISEKISLREKARADKNFKLADQIRDDLLREGIILEDTVNGVRWKHK
ncbi:MAG: cysteine--tRNA ligase, partial [Candidatus Aminicenantes bacterium]|nr:cysteine--tRNA ligase [Candidatus Aminicenantes bacterium]